MDDMHDEGGPALAEEESEAYRELMGAAERRTGKIPVGLLVRHALRVTEPADWPVKLAAFEALLRRLRSAERDGLRVSERPRGRSPFGRYRTRRARSAERPYETLLESLDPLVGSCNCPDFLRGSLGACKHLLTVVETLYRQPRKLEQMLAAPPPKPAGPRLVWDPIKPFDGRGDWLARVRLDAGRGNGRARKDLFAGTRSPFKRSADGLPVLAESWPDDPRRREALIEKLQPLLTTPRANGRTPVWTQPALTALFEQEKERLAIARAGEEVGRSLHGHLRTLKRGLYDYQVDGVARMIRSGRLLLGDDMGLGKTAQAIALCHVLWRAEKVRRGLIVVPASLKSQWHREWTLFTDAPVAVVEGSPAERARAYRTQRSGFLIVNYEQVLRDLRCMADWKAGIIVLDEAQRIKNWSTKTAAYVKRLEPPFRLVLTGTPMENRLDELASILDWVDEDALQPKWRLTPWHTTFSDGKREITGARNLDTLRTRLAPCLLRRVRREVLDQLPPRTDTHVPVQLTGAQAEEHAALDLPIAQLVAIARRRPLAPAESIRLISLLTTQRIIANGLAQLRFTEEWPRLAGVRPTATLMRGLDSPKLTELREVLPQLVVDQGRKVVVFSQWRRMLQLSHWAVSDVLAEHGLRAAFFTGAERLPQRTRNVVDFHDDPATAVLFATDAGGVGLNLQRAANCVVNLELPWNPAVLEQRIGRIHRIGQKDPIDVYALVSQECIEQRIAALIGDKKALFDGLFEGTSDEVTFDRVGSFMSAIARIVEPVETPDLAVDDGEDAALAAERDVEALIEAADETQDAPPPARPGELLEVKPLAAPAPSGAVPAAAPEMAALLGGLQIRRRRDGSVSIDAPPEAAAGLAAMLETMAALLRASAAEVTAED